MNTPCVKLIIDRQRAIDAARRLAAKELQDLKTWGGSSIWATPPFDSDQHLAPKPSPKRISTRFPDREAREDLGSRLKFDEEKIELELFRIGLNLALEDTLQSRSKTL